MVDQVGFLVMDDVLWEELLSGHVCSVDLYKEQAHASAIVGSGGHVAAVDLDIAPEWRVMATDVRLVYARVVLDSDGTLRTVAEQPQ